MLGTKKIDDLVEKMVSMEASDLHLKVGAPPSVRVHGRLGPLDGYEVMRPEDTDGLLREILPETMVPEFEREGEADFSYSVQGVGRFRVNAFRQRNSTSIVMRFIPFGFPSSRSWGCRRRSAPWPLRSVGSSW